MRFPWKRSTYLWIRHNTAGGWHDIGDLARRYAIKKAGVSLTEYSSRAEKTWEVRVSTPSTMFLSRGLLVQVC